ncbi:MAG: PIN domain-containing protein [Tannerella sp.]|jgi:predicted nucleic acid-binding protein|nr:PIN domain-containing protein [Tannerella sp.]
MILFDTNILIEIYRNNPVIVALSGKIGHENIVISDVTRAELFYGARNKVELQAIRRNVNKLPVLHIQSEISEMAVNLVEKYWLSHKLDIEDALNCKSCRTEPPLFLRDKRTLYASVFPFPETSIAKV